MILFSGGLDNEKEAREYIARHGLTKDDVRMVRGVDYINVVSKGEIPFQIGLSEEVKPTEFYINALLQDGYSKAFIKTLYPSYKIEEDDKL